MSANAIDSRAPWTRFADDVRSVGLKCAIAGVLVGYFPAAEPWSLPGFLIEVAVKHWAVNVTLRRHFDEMSAAYQSGVDAFAAGLPAPPCVKVDVVPTLMERLRVQREMMLAAYRRSGWDDARIGIAGARRPRIS